MDLNEARKNLESIFGEEIYNKYFTLLRERYQFTSTMTKEQFDLRARKLLTTEEQLEAHNRFSLALQSKASFSSLKTVKSNLDKGIFEKADFADYVQPFSPAMLPPSDLTNRSAASELFIPDQSFISTRIALTAWEHGLDGARENVTDVIVNACQTFVRNIITAMISKKKGYKIRDGRFQYGFNQPIPDPFLRNYDNIVDNTQESKFEVVDGEGSLAPKPRISLEHAEQQTAFASSGTKRRKTDDMLTLRLLYDTLRANPKILGLSASHSLDLLKLELMLDNT